MQERASVIGPVNLLALASTSTRKSRLSDALQLPVMSTYTKNVDEELIDLAAYFERFSQQSVV